MNLDGVINTGDVLIGVGGANKRRVLEKLAAKAAADLSLDPDAILAALLKREELGSTGMGDGVALPHARLNNLKTVHAVFARLRQPVDFQSIDGAPVDLVCLLLLPTQGSTQLDALASVARRLREKDRLVRLRRARDPTSLRQALVEERSGS
jgi:PTS system nitrogen regulatory IIA component